MLFNPAESIDFNGNTGPFIQYTHARISALLRREEAPKHFPELDFEIHQSELEVIKVAADYKDVLEEAQNGQSPALVCNYIYDLVKHYNSFYQSVQIFNATEQEKAFRLKLSERVKSIVAHGMGVIGIQVPERM